MGMTFLRMRKECHRLRGELQNDSISGVSADEQQLIKDNLNKEMRAISRMRPPFLRSRFKLQLKANIDLDDSSSNNTATATKNIPQIYDSNTNLNKRHLFWLLTDGTYKYRITGNSGTTYDLSSYVQSTVTTNTAYSAYKDVYPLPHNCRDIMSMYSENGDWKLTLVSGALKADMSSHATSSKPEFYSIDTFTNRFSKFKFSHTSTTFTNGSNIVTVGTTLASFYDIGDNIFTTLTTNEQLFTVIGLSTNQIYLDRPFPSTTAARTVQCNPKGRTRYVSIYPYPNSNEDVVLEGYVYPQDLLFDTDECDFPEDFCWAIIIGALQRDKLSRGFLTQQDIAHRESTLQNMRQTNDAGITYSPPRRSPLGGRRRFGANDVGNNRQ